MLEPTDRILAKTAIKVLGVAANLITPDALKGVTAMDDAVTLVTMNNKELRKALMALMKETIEEMKAEERGDAETLLPRINPRDWD